MTLKLSLSPPPPPFALPGDKKFESLEDMVQDGLITLFLQKHDVAKLMELGRKDSMACKNEKNMRLKRQHGRYVHVVCTLYVMLHLYNHIKEKL